MKMPKTRGWKCMTTKTNFAWKRIVIALMRQYVSRTHGAFIENKGSAITFQHRDADPDFGMWQARGLAGHLQDFLVDYPVEVVAGKGYVEARLEGVNKGTACECVMQMLVEQGKIPDFVLCIGDDRSDEDMFASVTKFMQKFIHAEGTPKLAPVDKPSQSTGQEQADNTLERLMRQTLPTSSNSRTKSFPHTRLLSSIAHESAPRYRPGVDCPPPYVVTVTVGRKPSHAGFYVNDPQEVSQLLTGLSEPTTV